ncbi:hypothetical protein [Kitasatospora kazusensis]|uniref:hypothetical protein n=1 Tax=Kitasatospora kazusensis TaxID=407974 RepID=UPI0031E1B941
MSPVPAKPPVAGAVLPGPRPAPPRAARPGPPARAAQPPKPGPSPRRAGPAVQLVAASVQGAVEQADEAVDRLLESGRRPADILVLTAGEPHPWQQHELSFGEARYWAQLTEGDDVFYAAAARPDGSTTHPLGRAVVVLVVNDSAPARVERALRTALGLAGALLVVCGRPDVVTPLLPAGSRPTPA